MPLKFNSKTTVIDVGLTDAQKANKSMNGSFTKVGFPSEGQLAHGDGEDTGRKNMIDLATNAAILQFGIETKSGVKRWPFMSNAMEKNRKDVEKILEAGAKQIYAGNRSAKHVLGVVGEKLVNEIKAEMKDISAPKEEPKTIKKKKGVSNPTIDKGQMRNSVTHVEVTK